MSGYWLGRRTWLWLADGVLVAFGVVLLLTGNDTTRLIAIFIVASRLLLAGVQVLVWKRAQAAGGAGGGTGAPPR
ncbi:hypothetical protein [Amnibacterium kyonggiense]|uniref:Uncharacterized protein n=1 Tax=Amnibacterium kyonggiense TaxID=595671 RepID=A0A4R7FMB3_9MICO|nr:hypothetical protein [Amnibacterium kyonggiense]TDS77573.1 hypothetical protein CLV52_2528 [Amnibacterium kyonggiense]